MSKTILSVIISEILEYAQWLGMDVQREPDLVWIAREGLKAPLPEHWKPW
jgi:centrosomal protein CEP164